MRLLPPIPPNKQPEPGYLQSIVLEEAASFVRGMPTAELQRVALWSGKVPKGFEGWLWLALIQAAQTELAATLPPNSCDSCKYLLRCPIGDGSALRCLRSGQLAATVRGEAPACLWYKAAPRGWLATLADKVSGCLSSSLAALLARSAR